MKTACLLLLVLCPPRGVCENLALSPSGERVARDGVFISRCGTGEGVPSRIGSHQHSRFLGRLTSGEGGSLPASSPAEVPHRPAQGGAGRVGGHSAPASRKANRPQQPLNSRQGSLAGEGTKRRQPGSDQFRGATNGESIQGKTVNKAVPVRTPSAVRPTAPVVNNLRHRSPNAAVVSGSLNSHSSNTGAINGARMNHRM